MLRFITSRCCCTIDVSPADCAGEQAIENNPRVHFLGAGVVGERHEILVW